MTQDPDISTIKQVEIPEAFITLRSDKIVSVHYKKDTVLDVELQVRMQKIFLEITGSKKTNFIFFAEEGFTLTKEAREYWPLMEKESPVLFYAIIANSLPYRIIANFYTKVMRPNGSYKVFPNVEAAAKWLNSLKSVED